MVPWSTVTLSEVADNVIYDTVGIYTVTVRATDTSSNYTDQTFNVQVIDTTAPSLNIYELTFESGSVYDFDFLLYATDNSTSMLYYEEFDNNVIMNKPGTYSFIFTLRDESFNMEINSIIIHIIDTTPPSFDIQDQSISVGIYDSLWPFLENVYDNSDYPLLYLEVAGFIDYNEKGVYTVVVRLSDGFGNYTDKQVTITLIDDLPPTFSVSDQVIEVGAYTWIDWVIYIEDIKDNYSVVFILNVEEDQVIYDTPGTYPVTVSVTDQDGHYVEKTFNVTVVDTTPPTFDEIPDQYIEAGDYLDYDWILLIENATDNSNDPLPRTEVEDNVIYNQVGSYTVTVKLMDQSLNETSQTFTVYVIDTTPPTFEIENQTIEAGSENIDWSIYIKAAYDNSNGELIFAEKTDSVDYHTPGVYPATVTVTDQDGNVAEKTIEITVIDTTPPVFDYIETQIIEAGEFSNIDWTILITNESDNTNCEIFIKIEVSDNVIYDKIGDYEVTVKLIDEYLNETTQTFTVTVTDTTSPTFNAIADQMIEVGEYTDIDWTYLIENLQDNGIDELIIEEVDRIDYGKVGIYQVTIIVYDLYNNQSSRSFNVEVIDTTPPTFNTIEDQVIEAGDYYDWTDLIINEADNSNDFLSKDIYSDETDYYTAGTYEVTLRVRDLSGNEAFKTFNVTVIDTLPPDIAYIEDQVIEAGDYLDFDWASIMEAVYDNTLKEMEKFEIIDNVIYNQIGTYTVTLGARDASGNESTITINVLVVDTTSPLLTLRPNLDTIYTGTSYNDTGIDIYDVTNTELIISGMVDINTPGTYIITYTVTDQGGNSTIIKRIITVVEKQTEVSFSLGEALTTIKKGDAYIDGICKILINQTEYDCTVKETNLNINQAGMYYILYTYTYQEIEYSYKRIVFVLDSGVNKLPYVVYWKEDEE